MSRNLSRGDKIEPQSRKPGRSGVAGQTRGFPGGGGGRGGGGGFAPPPVPIPAPSDATGGRSFRKPGNVQGGQTRGQPMGVNPTGLTAVGNGPQIQPPFPVPGTHDVPKAAEVSAPKPSRAAPRPPSGPADPTTSVWKGGDGSKPFTLQFGSINPGFVNGVPIPARTSSAPPNLDEQKRDQASPAVYGTTSSAVPVPSVTKQQPHPQGPQHKEAIGPGPAGSGNPHPTLEAKRDNPAPVSIPLSMPSQKSSGVSIPGISMPMFPQPPQMPLQFGGPNIAMQQQHVAASSMQMPMPQMPIGSSPQMYVPGIQTSFVPQGQNLVFLAHMGHHMPSTMGHAAMGMGMGTQYSQPQAGKFVVASRKAQVKITHPVTREELKLDKKEDSQTDTSGQRSSIPPQSQPPPFPTPQINAFHNPQGTTYAGGSYYPTHSLSSSQPTVSQAPRFSFQVSQGGTPVSIVNPSTLTSASVAKPGMSMQKGPEQSHVGQSHGGKMLSISAPAPAQVTVKASVSIAPHGATSVGSGTAVVKDGGLGVAKPFQEASLISQQKANAVGPEVSHDHLKSREAELEVAGVHLNSSVKPPDPTPISIDNQHPASVPSATAQASNLVIEPINSPPQLNIEAEELPISDSLKHDKSKTETLVQMHLEQGKMEEVSDAPGSSNMSPTSLIKETSSLSSDERTQEYSEDVKLMSKTDDTPEDSCVSLVTVDNSSGTEVSKGDIACITSDPLVLPDHVESELKDAHGQTLSTHPMANGAILRGELTSSDSGAAVTCQEDVSQILAKKCQETVQSVEPSESSAHDSFDGSESEGGISSLPKHSDYDDPLPDVKEDISNQTIAPEHLDSDGSLKNVNGEMARVMLENNEVTEEDSESNIRSVSPVASFDNLAVHEAKSENIPELNVTDVNSRRPLLQPVVSDSDSSNKNLKGEEVTVEIGGQASCSSSVVKDKPVPESSRAKTSAATGKKKKKKELLEKANAAGVNSDMYMAYKKPEERQVASASANVMDNSSVDDEKKLQTNDVEDITTKEDGQNKSDIDDWEAAVEIPSPTLESPEESGRYGTAKKLGHEIGVVSSRKRYSRDFLLTFLGQCRDLPTGLEIGSDVAPLFSVQVGGSHALNIDMLPGQIRIIDRPNTTSRADRRMANYADDDKWTKATNQSLSRDGGFRAGQGGIPGVIKNHPRGQGGILPGQMQALVPQGVSRNSVDADRWHRASGRGLMPSPQTPAPVMHKAEKKYEVGKVSDDEEAKQRQIKSILNKLTPQNFDRLFQQVKDVNIDNKDTLIGVISQIFDKALAEPTFCEMYANFCLDLATALPDFIEGKEKITFKRLLLNKCQEEFERGEREQAEADKVEEEGETKQSEAEKEELRIKARRRMLGNIRLIGELYKKRMLTERIMHECMKKLLGQHQNPDEEDIEALCKLMSTIGAMIDHAKAKEHMDAYFDIMRNLSLNQKLSSRVRFMLKDAIDLRKNNWQQRRKVEGPKKIEEVHRDAAQERAHAARPVRGSGMGSSTRKGQIPIDYGSRSLMPPSSVVPPAASLRSIPAQTRGFGSQDVRMEDRHLYESRTLSSVPLSQRPLGDDSITLGPQGGLAKGMSSRGQPLMVHPPTADISSTGESARRMVAGPNGHSSILDRNVHSGIRDLGRADRNSDRSTSKASLEQNLGSSAGSAGISQQSVSFSEEQLHHKSISAIREYYSAKDEKEICLCIKELNSPDFYPTMVSIWVNDSLERKDAELELLSRLLVSLCKPDNRLLSQVQLIQGFEQVLSTLEDAKVDAPKAPQFVGRIFVRSILEDIVPFQEIGRLLQEGGEKPGQLLATGLAADVLGSVLEIIRTEKGDATMKGLCTNCSLSLESFRPPHQIKSSKLEQFL